MTQYTGVIKRRRQIYTQLKQRLTQQNYVVFEILQTVKMITDRQESFRLSRYLQTVKIAAYCNLYSVFSTYIQTIKDYVELILTTTEDAHMQYYGPRLQITSCPSRKEQPRNTRPCPVKTNSNCKDSYRLLRQLKPVANLEKQMHTVADHLKHVCSQFLS